MVDKATEGQSGKPDADRKDQPETSDKPRSLEALLAEWTNESNKGTDGEAGKTPRATPEPEDKSLNRTELRAEVRDELREAQREERDLKSLISQVKGDLGVDDDDVEDWLNGRAAKDEDLQRAWSNRSSNKSAFKEVSKALASEYQAYVKKLTERLGKKAEPEPEERRPDRGLAAAVRSARETSSSGTGFDDVQWSGLPEHEFERKKHELFRAAKAGKLG